MIFRSSNPRKWIVWAIVVVALLTAWTAQGQTDSTLFYQINQLRGPKHQLTYNTAKQAQVDKYVASGGFKKFLHSGMNCGEILVGSSNHDDFIPLWLGSRPHTKIIKDKKFKSMAYRVVEVRKGYYQAVVQFYE